MADTGACSKGEEVVVLERTLGEECSRFDRVVHCHRDLGTGAAMYFAVDVKEMDSLATVGDMPEVERGRSVRSGS